MERPRVATTGNNHRTAALVVGSPKVLSIMLDPRTGKPWKSMKAAREWYDLASKLCNSEMARLDQLSKGGK